MEGATQVEEVFLAALEIPPGQHRERYLMTACGGDGTLRRRVERLLDAHPKAGGFLERPAADTDIHVPSGERSGVVVAGRYKLLELIGEGGMGAVWLAEQTEPVRRKVALKVVKPGMDSKSVLARFEQERQALALMDHPNIATVLDGGLTDEGRPFFVMDYVKGTPITDHCDGACLNVADRLRLFVQVCEAVQHAHQKGVVHRDLKPSNILVAPYDGRPVPKVIDFGVAKALHQPLTERTLFTAHETVLGTPLYMSPEQAELNNLDVDTRADVYSLGVLLYELLTGTTPLERSRFREAAWNEVRRIIHEEEPPRPSTRLSTTAVLPALAKCRDTEPAALSKIVRGDLDWITMRCLEKDRARRYESASALARDLERFLNDEPVEARPPTAAYRLQKFAKKNRAMLASAAALTLMLAGATVVSAWQAVKASRAERNALAAATAAREAGERAQQRLAQVERGSEIIAAIFADLDMRQSRAAGEPLEAALAGRLVKAAEQLEGEAVGDPVVTARLQQRLGQSLLHLGHAQAAVTLFVKARATLGRELGEDHPDAIAATGNLASGYEAAGKTDRALPLFEEALRLRAAHVGADHPDTLTAMSNLADGYRSAGRLELALPLYEKAWTLSKFRLGADHRDTLVSIGNLATGYASVGKLANALPLYEEALKLSQAKLGPDHPDTLTAMNNLAEGYRASGLLDRALPLLEESLRRCRARLGSDHPETVASMGNLANGYREARKLDLAFPLYEEALKLSRARLGPEHPATLVATNNLASGYWASGKVDLALPLLEETLKQRRTQFGADHPDTLTAMNNLAAACQTARQTDRAIALFEEAVKLRKAKLGTDHPDTLTSMSNLAAVYQSAGKLDQSLPILEETLKLREAKVGQDHPETLISLNNLAGAYVAAKQLDRAIPLLERAAVSLEKRRFRHEHAERIMTNAIAAYEKAKQPDKAESWRRKWSAAAPPTPRGGASP